MLHSNCQYLFSLTILKRAFGRLHRTHCINLLFLLFIHGITFFGTKLQRKQYNLFGSCEINFQTIQLHLLIPTNKQTNKQTKKTTKKPLSRFWAVALDMQIIRSADVNASTTATALSSQFFSFLLFILWKCFPVISYKLSFFCFESLLEFLSIKYISLQQSCVSLFCS